MTTQEGLPALATDVIAEVQRRLDTFHSPSFDREIVEQLLSLARRSAASAEPAVAVSEDMSAKDAPVWYRAEEAGAWAAGYNAALNAALSPAPAGEVGWRIGDTVWRFKLYASDGWTYTDRPLSPKELGPNGRQEQGYFPTGGDKL